MRKGASKKGPSQGQTQKSLQQQQQQLQRQQPPPSRPQSATELPPPQGVRASPRSPSPQPSTSRQPAAPPKQRSERYDATPAPRAASAAEFAVPRRPTSAQPPPRGKGKGSHRTTEWVRKGPIPHSQSFLHSRESLMQEGEDWDLASEESLEGYTLSERSLAEYFGLKKKKSADQPQQPSQMKQFVPIQPPTLDPLPQTGVRRRLTTDGESMEDLKRIAVDPHLSSMHSMFEDRHSSPTAEPAAAAADAAPVAVEQAIARPAAAGHAASTAAGPVPRRPLASAAAEPATPSCSFANTATDASRSFANVTGGSAVSPRSFASAAAKPPTSQPATNTNNSNQPKIRYPPLVVECLPNWPHHLGEIRKLLGRVANARPFGRGIRFSPADEEEYRIIQRYLGDLESRENISWHSYELPTQLNMKVAIRGLPLDTPIDALTDELVDRGFDPVFIRSIRGRGDRPGCILFGEFRTTPNIRGIYAVTELLNVPGVVVEAWRGKQRPAQCHRCQQFRHSSHHCHRRLACVRCGDAHAARDCPRPRETPATCINCGGPHPANYTGCKAFRREARNKKAGIAALTVRPGRGPSATQPTSVPTDPQAATLMAAANPATQRDQPPPKGKKNRRRRKKKKASSTPAAAPAPPTQQQTDVSADATHATPAPPAPTGGNKKPQEKPAPAKGRIILTSTLRILQKILTALTTNGDDIGYIGSVVLQGMEEATTLNMEMFPDSDR